MVLRSRAIHYWTVVHPDDPHDIVAAAVGAVVRQERLRLGLTLEELAATAGLHRTAIGLIERGERGLGVATASRLAAALDMEASELIRLAEQSVAADAAE